MTLIGIAGRKKSQCLWENNNYLFVFAGCRLRSAETVDVAMAHAFRWELPSGVGLLRPYAKLQAYPAHRGGRGGDRRNGGPARRCLAAPAVSIARVQCVDSRTCAD